MAGVKWVTSAGSSTKRGRSALVSPVFLPSAEIGFEAWSDGASQNTSQNTKPRAVRLWKHLVSWERARRPLCILSCHFTCHSYFTCEKPFTRRQIIHQREADSCQWHTSNCLVLIRRCPRDPAFNIFKDIRVSAVVLACVFKSRWARLKEAALNYSPLILHLTLERESPALPN